MKRYFPESVQGIFWDMAFPGQVEPLPGLQIIKGFEVTPWRIVLIIIGLISLALGIIGIFLPLLPTVPFVLLSAACFSRGSTRMHAWLVRMPFAGKLIDDYEKGRGVSRKSKATALLMLWGGMSVSAIMMKPAWWVLAILATIAISSTVIIVRLPKRKEDIE